ncbi:MAG: MFS transporter [Saprospiraceae bacterium]
MPSSYPKDTPDTTSYFSFYDVMDKISTVVGTFTFGIVEQLTRGMRNSVMAMATAVISVVILSVVKIRRTGA